MKSLRWYHLILRIVLLGCAAAVRAGAVDPASGWEMPGTLRGLPGILRAGRDDLEAQGIGFSGSWKGTFYGLTSGGLYGAHGAFDEEITFAVKCDFGKLGGVEGLTGYASVRYRDGRNPNTYVGASSTFNPSRYQSGQQWRLMPFYLTYTTPELFGIRHLLTLSAGWQNAYSFFADQPESKLFTNNAIGTTKGIGGVNGFPWSSSYAAWGGYAKVDPSEACYVMAGLYLAIPEATDLSNHGLDFEGYGPNPKRNGVYFLAESGWKPTFGTDARPGKYAFGMIYWGLENRNFQGTEADQKCTFYWQADQVIFRETRIRMDDSQGLHAFAFFNYAPPNNNAMPFYFHAGLVYHGAVPGRDQDQAGLAFGHGIYSGDKASTEGNAVPNQSSEAVVEATYRLQLTPGIYLQPFWQYLIRPDGTGIITNANIFGLHMALAF